MKKIYVDLDNTLCTTTNGDYSTSTPILERIAYFNVLKEQGHNITIWTARGTRSGVDYAEFTKAQLNSWNVMYDELLMQKPDYDIYYDDKSFNIDDFLPVIKNNDCLTKKEVVQIVG